MRIEDVDRPRVVGGATDSILHALDDFGLHWDGAVVFQSARIERYRDELAHLQEKGLVYDCVCSRRELANVTRRGITGELFYPGTCRDKGWKLALPVAQRVRVPSTAVAFHDLVQGPREQNLAEQSGDFVLLRADGIFSYHLAVVVDDAEQGITEIVRGSDLLDSTPRHLFLQKVLDVSSPTYFHIPVVVEASGEKLSKQTRARPLEKKHASELLYAALAFLGQNPSLELQTAHPQEILKWALQNWYLAAIPRVLSLPLPDSEILFAGNNGVSET